MWGEFRRVLAKNRGQPRRLACQSNAPQKNTLFIRKRKNPARAKRKEKRVFFCGAASVSERRRGGFIRREFPENAFGFRSGCGAKKNRRLYAPSVFFVLWDKKIYNELSWKMQKKLNGFYESRWPANL